MSTPVTWSPASSRASGLEDASRVASLVGQIERPIASAKADAAYDTGDVYKDAGESTVLIDRRRC